MQRFITGIVSAALLIVVLYIGGWLFDVCIMALSLFGCYEMLSAFQKADLHPPRWPVYGIAALMIPAYLLTGKVGVYLLAGSATMVIMLQIALRKHPRWPDAAASLNVLINIPIPMVMLYPIIRIEPRALGTLMVFLIFVIALLGDIFAYFIGVTLGKHRMAPELSPKKTWEGSAAGLVGSVVGAVLLNVIAGNWVAMPPVWHFAILGAIGGVAGQLGDLSASLIKRYCGIKDFGTLFPGHGGMMDRFDSILFVTYVVFGYCMAAGFL